MTSASRTNSLPISIYSDEQLSYEVSRIRAKRNARINPSSPQKDVQLPPSPNESKDSLIEEIHHSSLPLRADPMNWSYRTQSERDSFISSRLTDPQEVGRLISAVRRSRRERLGIKEPYVEPKNPFMEDSLSDFQVQASSSLPANIPSIAPPNFASNPPSAPLMPPAPPSAPSAPPVLQDGRVTPRSSVVPQTNVPKVAMPTVNASTQIEEPAAQPKLTPRTALALQQASNVPQSEPIGIPPPIAIPPHRLVPETRTISTSPIVWNEEMSLEELSSGSVPLGAFDKMYSRSPDVSVIPEPKNDSEVMPPPPPKKEAPKIPKPVPFPHMDVGPMRRSHSEMLLRGIKPPPKPPGDSVPMADLLPKKPVDYPPLPPEVPKDNIVEEVSAHVARVKAKRSGSIPEAPSSPVPELPKVPTEESPLEVKDLEIKPPKEQLPTPEPVIPPTPAAPVVMETPKPEPTNKYKRDSQSPWRITSDRIQKFKILISPSESRLQELQHEMPPPSKPIYNPRPAAYWRN